MLQKFSENSFLMGAASGCCQTNDPKHQFSFGGYVYEVKNDKNQFHLSRTFSVVLRVQNFYAFLDNYAHSIGILEFHRSKY